MRPACELCGYATKPSGYVSLADCNETGVGVVLHQQCAFALEVAKDFGGPEAAKVVLKRVRRQRIRRGNP